uniref:Uncharacterized protein n=1 Tax=Siphoviridae sp. ctS2049 TaxID=2825507 RepID=A0A8S5V8Z0_9CAUD|nr:MAG TPA: hypothetical protein [Siphoviridae sp. ctS2049]
MLPQRAFKRLKPHNYRLFLAVRNYSHSFPRLSFVLFYIYSKPFLHCFEVIFCGVISFIITRVAIYVANMVNE